MRILKDNFASIGKMLIRGTYAQIANAIFKTKQLRVELIKLMLKQLSRECANFTSKKFPSILRKTSTNDILKFRLEKVCQELKERAPLYYSLLVTCASPSGRKLTESDSAKDFIPSVAVAGSILLRGRCKFLNATQVMIAMILKFSGMQVQYFIMLSEYY